MTDRDALRIGIGLLALTLLAVACREGEPVIDPKTPANSPIPKIERSEDPPVNKPAKDGG